MSSGEFPRSGLAEMVETWLYQLNERNHWFFRFLEWGNDQYARLAYRRVRRRAATIDDPIPGRDRVGRLRFLKPEDLDVFVALPAGSGGPP